MFHFLFEDILNFNNTLFFKLGYLYDNQRLYLDNEIKLTNGYQSEFSFTSYDLESQIGVLTSNDYIVDMLTFKSLTNIPPLETNKFHKYKNLIKTLVTKFRLNETLFTSEEKELLKGKLRTPINFDQQSNFSYILHIYFTLWCFLSNDAGELI